MHSSELWPSRIPFFVNVEVIAVSFGQRAALRIVNAVFMEKKQIHSRVDLNAKSSIKWPPAHDIQQVILGCSLLRIKDSR